MKKLILLFLILMVTIGFGQTQYTYIDYYRLVVKTVQGISPVDTVLYSKDFQVPIVFEMGTENNFPGWYPSYGDSNFYDIPNTDSLYSGGVVEIKSPAQIAVPVRIQLTLRAHATAGYWFPYKAEIYIIDFVDPNALEVPSIIWR